MNKEGKNIFHQALKEAFDAPWAGPVGEPVWLEKDDITLCIYPQDGARITSLQAFGIDVLRQWNPQRRAFQYGCFPMVPWVGRLGNATLNVGEHEYLLPANKPPHALHGMACYSSWKILEQKPDTLVLHMPLASPWPWKGDVLQRFSLRDNALVLRLEIHSETETFPASAGWHPWFVKHIPDNEEAAELQVSFDADWQEEAGSNELPTGKCIPPQPGPWDDCFGFSSGVKVSLVWSGALRMTMCSSAQSLVVFDKQPDATCVNPLSQAPNDINLMPQFVTPDAPLIIETCWTFTPQ